jgi:hypothetical protein
MYSTHPRAMEARIRRLAWQKGLQAHRRRNLWYFARLGRTSLIKAGLPAWKALLFLEETTNER